MNSIAAATAGKDWPHTSCHLPVVFVVDDDVSVRESLELLILRAGWEVRTFSSAHEFLKLPRPSSPCCLILDVGLPEMDGLDLQQRISTDWGPVPIIFISACCDVKRVVRAMKAGAVEFLAKPVRDLDLLAAIREALELSKSSMAREAEHRDARRRYATLTARESQVMWLVVRGLQNRQIGTELGISEITVKAHRGRMMHKMQADSIPGLVTLVARLNR